jgi:hypothetical protein
VHGKLHRQWQTVKPVPAPFIPCRNLKKRRGDKQQQNVPIELTIFQSSKSPKSTKVVDPQSIFRIMSVDTTPKWLASLATSSGFVRMLSMKLINQLLGIFEVLCRLPTGSHVTITSPLHEAVNLPIAPFGVDNRIDFPLFRMIDNCCKVQSA